MFKRTFIYFLFAPFFITAQVLVPTPETAFEVQHNFNSDVIKRNGIKKITFEIIEKKDFEVPVDKNLVETYEFNPEGFLSRYYYTNIAKTLEKHIPVKARRGEQDFRIENEYVYDTVSTTYFYLDSKLVLKRYHDGGSYYESRYYRYDSLGNLTKELRFKETNNSSQKTLFVLGSQVRLSEDSFQYHKYNSGQVKCIFFNNENRPYKERITNVDSLGRKTRENESYVAASWVRQESRFKYNGNKLAEAVFEGNTGSVIVLRNVYEYDEKNELYTEKQYRNDVLQKEISFVSDRTNGLLHSMVIRYPANKSIRIVKLKYDLGLIGKSGG